jgi:gluconate kinase
MPESLLESQFDALERPDATEAIVVDVAPPVPAIVDAIVRALALGATDRPRS